ncbi:hypothetical protein SRB5_31580 [Streptomyces sp. RB5]|uniref:N-acetyltransferase domain-containing protein n=1 Tax=Streptomyces smaragdinus TaxID=2585196 RepID=A0A7K0CHS4_9ACTN|nr:GNAT family N-acetyltransferase [Streptomyces smaragdinus]MQY13018.1 hypothetical protein [Streptomyces smaragdinus]
MRPDDWHLTEDLTEFDAHAGGLLRERPALYTTQLTTLEKLRAEGTTARFGWRDGAFFYWLPTYNRLTLGVLTPSQADGLAAWLDGLGHRPAGVLADHDTASAFSEAWRERTGASYERFWRGRLHRLGELTPPEPRPAGAARLLDARDRGELMRWCDAFVTAVGESPAINAGTWAASRFADKHFTFWETPDGVPVSLAGSTSMVGGMIRVDPVYTPAGLRGQGYAGAVTAAVTGAALAAGASDVVLYTDPGNPTSNALYRRVGYVPLAEFTGYTFAY